MLRLLLGLELLRLELLWMEPLRMRTTVNDHQLLLSDKLGMDCGGSTLLSPLLPVAVLSVSKVS